MRAGSAHAYPLLVKHLLHAPLARAPEQQIVYRDRRRYTYREWHDRVQRLAAGLSSLGVRPGDTVAVMDWDSHRYLECYFAVPMMGAVLQTVNVQLCPEHVLYTLNHAGARVLLVNAEFLPVMASIQPRLETVKVFVLIDDGRGPGAHALPVAVEYERMLAAAARHFDFPDFDENTRATTLHTKGSSELPKGVSFTHRQLVLHTLAEMAALAMPASQGRFHGGDVYMPMTPMFHVHAWGMPYVATALGVKQVYAGRYSPETLLRLIRHEGVTFSHCVPTVLQMLLSDPASLEVDLSSWKVIVGGSSFSRGLARLALERGIDAFGGYGMAEACPLLALAQVTSDTAPEDLAEEVEFRTKAGVPVPLVDLRIVDAAMNDVPHDGNSSGEVVVRAPWLAQGYVDNPKASEHLWRGGYLHTGDFGTIDDRGCLQITDRRAEAAEAGGR